MDLNGAANAADALLAVHSPGVTVLRDASDVFVNDEVFAFTRNPAQIDDQLLVVDRGTGQARFVTAPPFLPHPFPGLVPVDELEQDLISAI